MPDPPRAPTPTAAAAAALRAQLAAVERALDDRPPGTIYLDHLQNARGKTLAAAFTARARSGLPVSTPLPWAALRAGLDPRRHTVATVPGRLATIERHWAAAWAAARAAMP